MHRHNFFMVMAMVLAIACIPDFSYSAATTAEREEENCFAQVWSGEDLYYQTLHYLEANRNKFADGDKPYTVIPANEMESQMWLDFESTAKVDKRINVKYSPHNGGVFVLTLAR